MIFDIQVLIVEDEVIAVMALSQQIEQLGYPKPDCCYTPTEVREYLDRKRPDIVLMDIGLNSTDDGIVLAGEIRKKYQSPVIFLTGNMDNATLERAHSVEPAGYLSKPYNVRDIHSTIQLTVRSARAESHLGESLGQVNTILNNLPEGVFILKNEEIQFMNQAAIRLTGCSEMDLLTAETAQVLQLVNSRDNAIAECFFHQLRQSTTQVSFSDDTFLLNRKGEKIPVRGYAQSFRESDRSIIDFIVLFQKVMTEDDNAIHLQQETLKHIVRQRVELSTLKRQLDSSEDSRTIDATTDNYREIKEDYRNLLIRIVEDGSNAETVWTFCQRLYQESIPPFEVMEMYMTMLPEVMYSHPEWNARGLLDELRFANMEIFATLSELFRNGGRVTAISPMDKSGIPLELDASEDEIMVFRQKTIEQLVELNEILLEMERDQHNDEMINTAFRIAHTLKGNSGMVKHQRMALVTHEMEAVMELIRSGKLPISKPIIDVMLKAMDILDCLVEELDTREQKGVPVSVILDDLGRYTKKGGAATNNQAISAEELTLNPTQLELVRLARTRQQNAFDISLKISEKSELPGLTSDIALREMRQYGDIIAQSPDEETIALGGRITSVRFVILSAETQDRLDMILSTLLDMEQTHITPWKEQSASETRTATEAQKTSHANESVRVNSEKLDALINLVGELVISQSRLSQIAHLSTHLDLRGTAEEIERLTMNLRDIVLNVRMIPIGTTWNKYRRMVRDIASQLGKVVTLELHGTETELDKTIAEQLDEGFMHLIRNCLDHGLEEPGVRVKNGKPEKGTITLSAENKGANVVITIEDDGAGLDPERIRAKAIQKELISEADHLTREQLFNLVFLPGFSTAAKVTNLSGRGVGMDVLKQKIESLRGSVILNSEPGKFTRITLLLPLTLSIIEGMLVEVSDNRFIIPMTMVDECLERNAEKKEGQSRLVHIRDQWVPYVRLQEMFQLEEKSRKFEEIVVVKTDQMRTGLVVDRIIGYQQTVIKSLGKMYKKVEGVSGATILGDGVVALILDVNHLVMAAHQEEQAMTLVHT